MFFQTAASVIDEAFPGGRQIIRQALLARGATEDAATIMLKSISEKTINQYNKGIKLWWEYCRKKQIPLFNCSTPEILQFFSETLEYVKSYSTLNCYRAALSLLMGNELGGNAEISRFFKGVSREKPQKPRYQSTWDPEVVLNHLRTFSKNEDLPLEKLSKKLAILLALVTPQRVQTLSKIRIDDITESQTLIQIRISERIKTSGHNRCQPILNIPFFDDQPNLCAASTLRAYLRRTSEFRTEKNKTHLFLAYKKPHQEATTQTISRWMKVIMEESGLDTTHFKPHSTRHASTSAAARRGTNIETIMKTAGWTPNSRVFANFYNRPIIPETNFAATIIQKTG